MIQELRREHDLVTLLEIAQLPKATYYYHRKKQESGDKYVQAKAEMQSIFHENKGRYGYRRITDELRNRGFSLNHKTVQRLMKELGLVCRVRMKKYRSYKGEVGKTADNKLNPVVVKKRSENYVLPRPLKSGDEVTVVSLGVNGFLLSDPDKSGNVTVKAGIIKTKVNIKDLMLCENTPTVTDKQGKKQPASKYSAYASVSRSASSEIDLRGMTGDEGWMCVDKYLDEAMVSGLHTVHLIHGKGTGALRNEIWYRLADDDRVASYRLGAHGEGDSGVTVVELR